MMEEKVQRMAAALTIAGGGGSPEKRLITESPVVIFSRRSCCMCHAMRALLSMVGVNATVIESEEAEEEAEGITGGITAAEGRPVIFIGGELIGGIERLVEMHLSGRLVPRLREVGAILEK